MRTGLRTPFSPGFRSAMIRMPICCCRSRSSDANVTEERDAGEGAAMRSPTGRSDASGPAPKPGLRLIRGYLPTQRCTNDSLRQVPVSRRGAARARATFAKSEGTIRGKLPFSPMILPGETYGNRGGTIPASCIRRPMDRFRPG